MLLNCDLLNQYKKSDIKKGFGINCDFTDKFGEELLDTVKQENQNWLTAFNANTTNYTIDTACKLNGCFKYYQTQAYTCVLPTVVNLPNVKTIIYTGGDLLAHAKIIIPVVFPLLGQADRYISAFNLTITNSNAWVTQNNISLVSADLSIRRLADNQIFPTTTSNIIFNRLGGTSYSLSYRSLDSQIDDLFAVDGLYTFTYTYTVTDGVSNITGAHNKNIEIIAGGAVLLP